MLDVLQEWDIELFLKLNGAGTPYLDEFMLFMSDKYVWIPLYLFLIFRLYQRHDKRFYLPLATIILVIVCTDQTTGSILKPFFERLRPCKEPMLDGLVYHLGKCRGYSFASGHAANTFGLAAIVYFLERSRFSVALLLWAAIVSYSRIYLGVHYPADVITGALIGIGYAFIWSWLLQAVKPELTTY